MLEEAARQLRQYFAGERTGFDLPMQPHGTVFQKRVWSAMLEIPCGQDRDLWRPGPSTGVGTARYRGRLRAQSAAHHHSLPPRGGAGGRRLLRLWEV